MPEVKTARVVASDPVAGGFHALRLLADAPLGAAPGQWAAMWTDVPNPTKPGDVLKRAWSFAALDGDRGFDLFVAVVGACTAWLAERRVDDVVRFTRPWGSRFLLDEEGGPVGLFATGSGISPVASLVDACVARGRPASLWWETDAPALSERVEAWRRAGVRVEVGARLEPRPTVEGEAWWLAGDGDRIDAVTPALAGKLTVERFFTPPPPGYGAGTR